MNNSLFPLKQKKETLTPQIFIDQSIQPKILNVKFVSK